MSDSESGIERVLSTQSMPDTYDVVPQDQEYKFRLHNWSGGVVLKKLGYTLQMGKNLPYTRDLKGNFSVCLLFEPCNFLSVFMLKLLF